MTNDEWRMKHENRMTNAQRRSRSLFHHSSFLRDSSFGLRHSSVHASHSFSLSYSYSCSLVRRSLGEGGCSCFVSRLEFSRKINHKWTRIDTNFMEGCPRMTRLRSTTARQARTDANFNQEKIICANLRGSRAHRFYLYTRRRLGNARETRDTGTRMNINY